SVSLAAVDQIQQREKINPDDVDEVPVKSSDFHRCVVVRPIATAHGVVGDEREQTYADNHVQRVQAGHDEVEGEEDLGVILVDRDVRVAGNVPGEMEA